MDQNFLAYPAVERYAKHLAADLTSAERDLRLRIVEDYAKFCDKTPDEMIAEIFDEVTAKYKKRGFYSDKAKEFAAEGGGAPSAVLFRSNVIRAFFIANGRRLPPERPAWM